MKIKIESAKDGEPGKLGEPFGEEFIPNTVKATAEKMGTISICIEQDINVHINISKI